MVWIIVFLFSILTPGGGKKKRLVIFFGHDDWSRNKLMRRKRSFSRSLTMMIVK